MVSGLDKFLKEKLEYLKSKNQYRTLSLYDDSFQDFSSNDYLALSVQMQQNNVSTGSSGSRLITGNSIELESLEKEIALWKKTEAALFFGSGYLANLGAIAALAGPRDVVFSDEFNHSCILDGIRLSGAKKFFYKHLDLDHLRELLKKHRANYDKAFVVTDTVFSMQGSCADLKTIIDLKQDYDFAIYIDEAHATGTMASNGAGLYADLFERGLVDKDEVEIQMGTFSKACAVEGAYIAGSRLLIDYLVNYARTFIYSTAPSPLIVSAVRKNLNALITAVDKRENLASNIESFRSKLDAAGFTYTNDRTAIFALEFETNEEVLALSESLLSRKILVKAIRPPTVKKPCLRICLHAHDTNAKLETIIVALQEACQT